MIKTILRRVAFVASAIFLSMALYTMAPGPGTPPYLGMTLLSLYCVATALAVLAIEMPSLDQRLRIPGVVCNVVAVAFPIMVWARWATGALNLSFIMGLVPSIGFSLLAIALLWVLEAEKVFKATRKWTIAVVALTFASFAIMAVGERRRYSGSSYAEDLEFLSTLASIAGVFYAATAVAWAIFLYLGLTKKSGLFADIPQHHEPKSDRRTAKGQVNRAEPVVEQIATESTLDLELKKYDVSPMDGKYEFMGMLYLTPEDAIAAAKRARGDN